MIVSFYELFIIMKSTPIIMWDSLKIQDTTFRTLP
jgi:hypothetical protein